ncbi:MAG: hypothetical protein K8S13_24535, partial [Desulfobacula sp.]|uniref:hypothetical protein n=1 Tax=Desulfobacula sp. TaxID=2593537 RepID=UPI0025BEC0DE
MRFSQWKIYLILLFALAGFLFTASPGFAAVDRVICVPWQGDPLKFHTAISNESARLKGVIKTTDTSMIWYKWVYGDGSESSVISEQGSLTYHVQADNTYSGAVGTPFTAKLVVADDSSFISTTIEDPYLVKLFENNQDARINIAIDDGLWWLFNHTYTNSYFHTYDGSPFMVWTSTWGSARYLAAPTASSVQAFAINNHKINGDPDEDPYVEAVQKGMNWLVQGYYSNRYNSYRMLRAVAISDQHA